MSSGTAYPFVAEFISMYGWSGAFLGILLFSSLYVFLKTALSRLVLTKNLFICGLGLFSAIMAYYQYTRDYLPQISKLDISIVFPYAYLCFNYKKDSKKILT